MRANERDFSSIGSHPQCPQQLALASLTSKVRRSIQVFHVAGWGSQYLGDHSLTSQTPEQEAAAERGRGLETSSQLLQGCSWPQQQLNPVHHHTHPSQGLLVKVTGRLANESEGSIPHRSLPQGLVLPLLRSDGRQCSCSK